MTPLAKSDGELLALVLGMRPSQASDLVSQYGGLRGMMREHAGVRAPGPPRRRG